MSDMAAPAPGQFDAQATGVTSASGTASQSLEGELHSLEQQLAELQVDAVINAAFCRFDGGKRTKYSNWSALRSLSQRQLLYAAQSSTQARRVRPSSSIQQILQSNASWDDLLNK